jgi:hypothetical protein
VSIIGKEANALDAVEAGIEHDWDDVRNIYRPAGTTRWDHALRVVTGMCSREAAQVTGLSERAIRRLRHGFRRPRRSTIAALLRAAPPSRLNPFA